MSSHQLIRNNIYSSGVIEITGVPCSGKTTYLKKFHPNEEVLLGGIPPACNSALRVLWSFHLFFYALLSGALKPKQAWWLAEKSFKYDETLFSRINALRNCTTKFGYNFFIKEPISTLIDEGISHIPFILGLEADDIDDFIILFRHNLKNLKIIFIQAPTNKILETRIITRGHKRLRAAKDASAFINRNIRIAGHYKKALIAAGFNVSFI